MSNLFGLAVSMAREKWLEKGYKSSDATTQFDAAGQLIQVKWAEKYADAVRKLDDAAVAARKCPVDNCAGLLEYLERFYHWKYRLDRLQMCPDVISNYTSLVQLKLNEAGQKWAELERNLLLYGPKIYDDVAWHDKCSDDCCTYPTISGPTLTSTTADFGPMKLKPIPPPLPPRPLRKP